MQVITNQTVTVTLQLTESEAIWLKAVMQNQFWPDEDVETADNRCKLFNALRGAVGDR